MNISIFLVRHLHSKNVTAKISSLITKATLPLVVLIFIDDTNLHVFNSGVDIKEQVVIEVQQLLDI